MHFRFLTSTPLNIIGGSGTFAGISTLAKFLKISGQTVDLVTPTLHFPVYTLERLLFNEMLRFKEHPQSDSRITVGFDMDGYALAGTGRGLHVAAIKGVIADEMRFEAGLTNATMRLQAACEKRHVQRADLVIATSQYSAERIQEFYAISKPPRIVPELLDLSSWRQLLQSNPSRKEESKFVVLSVCRFYPRKRLHLLLGAADRLRSKIPGLEIRIVGDGPEAPRLKSLWQKKNLQGTVTWLGNVTQAQLAQEYNRCNAFSLPSVQEGFGIVFLEAMASGKPIVAACAGAAPEVVKHGILVEPDNEESLAEGIQQLYENPVLRATFAEEGSRFVNQFDAPIVTEAFLREIERAAGMQSTSRTA
jgi:glycosyltransferase involved in cell wall biosynthesis